MIEKNFAVVASRTSWALMKLMKLQKGEKLSPGNQTQLKEGRELLNRLLGARGMSATGVCGAEVYLSVRKEFFVERVKPGQPGYDEWNAVINQEFQAILFSPFINELVKMAEGLDEILRDSPVPAEWLDKARETFATFCLWVDNNYLR